MADAREHLRKIIANALVKDCDCPPSSATARDWHLAEADAVLALGTISERWEVHGPPDQEHPSGWMSFCESRADAEKRAKRQKAEVRVRYSIEMSQAFPVGGSEGTPE